MRDDAEVDQGFIVSPDESGRLDFDLQTAWSPRMRDAFAASGADGLVANYARGFIGHDLEFIRDLPLRRLNVLARTIRDLSPIYDLADSLQELHVQAGSMTRIDLGPLQHLRTLSCEWDQVADTIGEARGIEDLYLGSYNEPDLDPIAHLGIYLAPLEDTSALARINSLVLTELSLASCRRITALSDMSGLMGLRHLDVSEAGSLESLQPIADLRLLESLYLYGSTNVSDGDLASLLGMTRMRDLRMMNRRHYAPSVEQVKAHLAIP